MTYDQLRKFITEDMQMQHIYQPVMLKQMLLSEYGAADAETIAKAILDHDPTQIEYYAEVVKKMPGVVLTKNRKLATKVGKFYSLNDFEKLTRDSIDARPERQFLEQFGIRSLNEQSFVVNSVESWIQRRH